VHAGVDFLAQDLLGALDGQRGDLLAQRLAGLDGLLLGLGTGGGDDLGAFFAGAALASSTICCARRSASARRLAASSRAAASCGFDALVGGGQFGLGLVGGGQAVGDLARARPARR
jgi:hypothetical protein